MRSQTSRRKGSNRLCLLSSCSGGQASLQRQPRSMLLMMLLVPVVSLESKDHFAERLLPRKENMPMARLRGGGVKISEWLMLSRVGNDSDQSRVEQNQKLQEAAERGCCDGISSALEAGAEVNGRGPGLWTALHLAARYGHAKAVERLVEAGANVEQRNKLHFAPLHHAAMRGHTDVAKKLVELGADVHAITLEGHTAMDWAERNGHMQTMLALDSLMANSAPRLKEGTVTTFKKDGSVEAMEPVQDIIWTPPRKEGDDPWHRFDRFEWEGRSLPSLSSSE